MTQTAILALLSSEDRHTEPKHLQFSRSLFIGTLLVVLLSACSSTTVSPVDPSIAIKKFGFLRDGETTKQEVLDRMGHPLGVHGTDRTLTYRVFENVLGKIDLGVSEYPRTEYALVLMFNDKDVLRQHSLILKGERQ